MLDRLPKREQAGVGGDCYGDTQPRVVEVLGDDWECTTAVYDFSEKHRRHLRTTNVVESPFTSVRLP